MDRYIQQLLEDLERAAQNPPKPSYIEIPPGFEEEPSLAELGLMPFKTIEELTGIKQEAFPDLVQLSARHWRPLTDAIFKVFDSLKIKLFDEPRGIAKEWLYDALTSSWNQPVQFLPESGMDLLLCSGDPADCPYGMYCSCSIEWPDDEDNFEIDMKLPENYEEILPRIAKIIDSGMVAICFTDTMELLKVSQADYYNSDSDNPLFKTIHGGKNDGIFYTRKNLRIEALLDYERSKMMEDFASGLRVEPLRRNLFKALLAKNPYESFNTIVSQSPEKQNWLVFKQNWLVEHVRAFIWHELREVEIFREPLSGIFNDDGTRIDPEKVPLPGLCLTCKEFYTTDAENNILCMLNRNDQRNENSFNCGTYEEI